MGDDPGGIVNEGDQVGLALASAHPHGGAVHHVAHPHLAGPREGEAAAVGLTGGVCGFVHQAVAGQQAMDGGRGNSGGTSG